MRRHARFEDLLLARHVFREIKPADGRALDAHLATCAACRAAEARVLARRAALAALPTLAVPRRFEERLLRRIGVTAPPRPGRLSSFLARSGPLAAAAAFLPFVALSALLLVGISPAGPEDRAVAIAPAMRVAQPLDPALEKRLRTGLDGFLSEKRLAPGPVLSLVKLETRPAGGGPLVRDRLEREKSEAAKLSPTRALTRGNNADGAREMDDATTLKKEKPGDDAAKNGKGDKEEERKLRYYSLSLKDSSRDGRLLERRTETASNKQPADGKTQAESRESRTRAGGKDENMDLLANARGKQLAQDKQKLDQADRAKPGAGHGAPGSKADPARRGAPAGMLARAEVRLRVEAVRAAEFTRLLPELTARLARLLPAGARLELSVDGGGSRPAAAVPWGLVLALVLVETGVRALLVADIRARRPRRRALALAAALAFGTVFVPAWLALRRGGSGPGSGASS